MGKRKRYSIVDIVMLTVGGCIFIAVGIGVLIAIISSAVRADKGSVDISIAVPIIAFGLFPIVMGSIPLAMTIKQIYHIVREKKANKSELETTAKIADYKIVSYNGMKNKRYALKLAYYINGEKKTFTTEYLYDINEFRYLKSLSQIKVKVDGNFVAITETFSEDIYKIDPKYEIEYAFYEQSTVKKSLRIWRILCSIALVLLVVSIVLTTVLQDGIYLIIGVILLVAVNIPFAIIIAVCLIKWIKGKRK